jgi:hypothetical protein
LSRSKLDLFLCAIDVHNIHQKIIQQPFGLAIGGFAVRYRFESSNSTSAKQSNGRTGLTWPQVFLVAGMPALLTLCGLLPVAMTRSPAGPPQPTPIARSVSYSWSGGSLLVQCQGFEPGDTAIFFLTPSMDRANIEREPVKELPVSPQGTCDSGPFPVNPEISSRDGWQLVAQSRRTNTLVNAAFVAAPMTFAQSQEKLVASIAEPMPQQQPTPVPLQEATPDTSAYQPDAAEDKDTKLCETRDLTTLNQNQWCVEYYPSRDQDKDPIYVDFVNPINSELLLDWRRSDWPPRAGTVPPSNYRMVFTGWFNFPETRSYRFTLRVQGSARIQIDGLQEIDAYAVGNKRPSYHYLPISQGLRKIKLEYYLDGGPSSISLMRQPDGNRNDFWLGRYYNSTTMDSPVAMIRQDEKLDFSWDASPGGDVQADNFSVQWLRAYQVPRNGMTCSMFADDKVRVYVDGKLVPELSNWNGPNVVNATVKLNAGRRFVEVHFVEQGGLAIIRFTCTPITPAY